MCWFPLPQTGFHNIHTEEPGHLGSTVEVYPYWAEAQNVEPQWCHDHERRTNDREAVGIKPSWPTCDLRGDTFTMAKITTGDVFCCFLWVENGWESFVRFRRIFLLKKLTSQVLVFTVMLFLGSHCQCRNGENGHMRK